MEAVTEIIEAATKELKVETRLKSIEDSWLKTELRFDRHRDTEVFVVSLPDEVLESLEEHHLQLQGMAGMGKVVDFSRGSFSK